MKREQVVNNNQENEINEYKGKKRTNKEKWKPRDSVICEANWKITWSI